MKLVNKELIKRANAILFFSRNVKYAYKLKIFKLLYFLDFIHFREVGRPVTDLEYYTYGMGPVPKKFHEEINKDTLPHEIKKSMEIVVEKDEMTGEGRTRFIPKVKVNLKVFTRREQKILQDLALIFKDAKAEEMSEVSHLKNEPWDKTKNEKGMLKKIDFLLALDQKALIDKDTAIDRYNSLKEMKRLFS